MFVLYTVAHLSSMRIPVDLDAVVSADRRIANCAVASKPVVDWVGMRNWVLRAVSMQAVARIAERRALQ